MELGTLSIGIGRVTKDETAVSARPTAPTFAIAPTARLEGRTIVIDPGAVESERGAVVTLATLTRDGQDCLAAISGDGPWSCAAPSAAMETVFAWTVRAANDAGATDVAGTVRVAADIFSPVAFEPSNWRVSDAVSAGGDELVITIYDLPDDGGAPIAALEFRADSGSGYGAAQRLADPATATHTIQVLPEAAASVQVRAINAVGAGPWSDAKTAVPTPLVAPTLFSDQAEPTVAGDYDYADPTSWYAMADVAVAPAGDRLGVSMCAVTVNTNWKAVGLRNQTGVAGTIRRIAFLCAAGDVDHIRLIVQDAAIKTSRYDFQFVAGTSTRQNETIGTWGAPTITALGGGLYRVEIDLTLSVSGPLDIFLGVDTAAPATVEIGGLGWTDIFVPAKVDDVAAPPAPTRFIYVAPQGDDANGVRASITDARATPKRTIQSAVNAAAAFPDDCVLVLVAGGSAANPVDYGNVLFQGISNRSAASPVLLVSETQHGARIVGQSNGSAPHRGNAVRIDSSHHIRIYNFAIRGNYRTGDAAPVKIEREVASGQPIPVGDVWIVGNRIEGEGMDLLKTTTCRELHVIGNIFTGACDQAVIDMVACQYCEITWNTAQPSDCDEGFTWKGGNIGMTARYNWIDTRTSARGGKAFSVGGFGTSRTNRPMPFSGQTWKWAETQDDVVEHSVCIANGCLGVYVRGAVDCSITGNYLEATGQPGVKFAQTPPTNGSTLWADQLATYPSVPAEFVDYAEYQLAGDPDRMVLKTRTITVTGNWKSATTADTDINWQNGGTHTLETPAAGDTSDVAGTPGVAGWDADAIYRQVGAF